MASPGHRVPSSHRGLPRDETGLPEAALGSAVDGQPLA